jgi:hypothetical protein
VHADALARHEAELVERDSDQPPPQCHRKHDLVDYAIISDHQVANYNELLSVVAENWSADEPSPAPGTLHSL